MALVSGKDSHAGKVEPPPINWRGNCIEPIAQVILLEAMNFAISSVQSRLNSIGKIYPEVEGSGEAMLDMIIAIRDALDGVPNCKGSTTMRATVRTTLEAPNNEINTSWGMEAGKPFVEQAAVVKEAEGLVEKKAAKAVAANMKKGGKKGGK